MKQKTSNKCRIARLLDKMIKIKSCNKIVIKNVLKNGSIYYIILNKEEQKKEKKIKMQNARNLEAVHTHTHTHK